MLTKKDEPLLTSALPSRGQVCLNCPAWHNSHVTKALGTFSTENLVAGPTASTRNDPRLSLRLTDASPLGNVSA